MCSEIQCAQESTRCSIRSGFATAFCSFEKAPRTRGPLTTLSRQISPHPQARAPRPQWKVMGARTTLVTIVLSAGVVSGCAELGLREEPSSEAKAREPAAAAVANPASGANPIPRPDAIRAQLTTKVVVFYRDAKL